MHPVMQWATELETWTAFEKHFCCAFGDIFLLVTLVITIVTAGLIVLG